MQVNDLNKQMREKYHAAGYTGKGIIFAIFDTGVNPVGWLRGKVKQVEYMNDQPNAFGFGAPFADYNDTDGHGTFIGGQVIEWCPDAEVYSYKMIGGGDLRKAIDHLLATAEKDKDHRYIANMSFTTPDQSIQPYIDKLVEAGIPVVCAAGNDGTEVLDKYPTCFESPICVAALRKDGSKTSFSVWHDEVDFAEWGNNVEGLDLKGNKTLMSGTSMAAPNVAGKAGLLLCTDLTMTEDALFDKLKEMSVDLMDNGKDPYTGWGFIELDVTDKDVGHKEDEAAARRTLKLIPKPRMSGADVKEAQRLLNKHGANLDVDGIFGTATDAAVKAFQKAKGLTVDGIIGISTWSALDKAAASGGGGASVKVADQIKDMEYKLKMMVGDEYIFGSQGHELTRSYLDSRRSKYPEYFTGGRYEWLVERIKIAIAMDRKLYCEDCSGLFWKCDNAEDIIPKTGDSTAQYLWSTYCKPINKGDVRAGDILFRSNGKKMVHMAIVGHDGTYEAAGTAYGVVFREDVFDRKTLNRVTGKVDTLKAWTHYGRLKVWS